MTMDEIKKAVVNSTPVYVAVPASENIEQGHILSVHDVSDTNLGAFVRIVLENGKEKGRIYNFLPGQVYGNKRDVTQCEEWRIKHVVKTLKRNVKTKDDLIRLLFKEPVAKTYVAREGVIRFARDMFGIYLS